MSGEQGERENYNTQERIDIMRRKNLMTALMCTVCLALSAPMAIMAEETESVTEAVETESADEQETEEAAAEAETEEEKAERPDYTASDYVTLGEYKGLNVLVSRNEITDEEVDQETVNNIRYYGDDVMESLTEGTVQTGDTVNIDYEGKLNGDAFDGGTAKGYDLEIGSGTFIDGFEDGLIGAAVGDTLDLELTFPENYTEELAGKDVVFTVTVNGIKRMKEITDDLVNTVTEGEYADLEAYRAYIRSMLEESRAEERESIIKTDLLTQISDSSSINEYPQELLDYSVDEMTSYYKQMADMYQMDFAEFLEAYFGMTEEEFNEQVLLAVQQNLQQELYIKAIAEAEGIEISDEEFAAGCEEYAQRYGFETADDVVEAIGGEKMARLSLLMDETFDFLVENAVVEEETEPESGTEAASEVSTEEATEAE